MKSEVHDEYRPTSFLRLLFSEGFISDHSVFSLSQRGPGAFYSLETERVERTNLSKRQRLELSDPSFLVSSIGTGAWCCVPVGPLCDTASRLCESFFLSHSYFRSLRFIHNQSLSYHTISFILRESDAVSGITFRTDQFPIQRSKLKFQPWIQYF